MQQRPEQQRLEQLRSQRTQPALPGASVSVSPLPASSVALPPPPSPARMKKRLATFWALLQLGLLGFLLGLLYLALYPLLAFTPTTNHPLQETFASLFPWWRMLNWTLSFPTLKQSIQHISWLNPTLGEMNRTLCWLFVLAAAVLLTGLASRVLSRKQNLRLSAGGKNLLLGWILLFTIVFCLIQLFSPIANTLFTHDLLLSSLYGRIVALYHANPFVILPTAFAQDPLQQTLNVHTVAPYGPVWVDLSMLATLFAQDSMLNTLLSFRVLGLLAHLLNCLLLWNILGRIKPELRLSSVCLYAWNPLVLLLGVGMLHQEIVLGSFLLLAVFFFLYGSAMLGWVFALLAALTNPLYLLLVPLFLPVLIRHSRTLPAGRRLVNWLMLLLVTILVVLLAYLPFWMGWGLNGVIQNILQVFWPSEARNSLDAALMHLPLSLPAPIAWILVPHHWMALALLILGCFLLFAIWLIDKLELVLFFSSWVLLLTLLLFPVYWPWYVLVPFVLALASANRKTISLAVLLTLAAVLSYYCWQWQQIWSGLGLLCLYLPAVLWGWSLFFSSTWEIMRSKEEEELPVQSRRRLSRPSWLSRPSRP